MGRVMRREVSLVVAALVLPGSSAPEARQPSPRNANYTLAATLDPVSRGIVGRGQLTWRNTSNVPATELRFHMYWNAWRDSASSWMREDRIGRTAPPRVIRSADAGFIDLTAIALRGRPDAIDLLPRARYIAPDDGNAGDRTVLAVPLDRPVQPGGTIVVDLAWNARVPRTVARTGAIADYFLIAHWFPKIGVLEDAGWNCHQFHRGTEFFADYGIYDVQLTVPVGWIVGATGRERSQTSNAKGATTHHYVAEDVHDFAWTTSPDFVDVRERFEEPGMPVVDLRLLLQPEHRDQRDRHLAAVRTALKYYGSWFGPYPYGHLTIVDPVTVVDEIAQGGGTDGMEYPMLITAGTRWVAPWKEQEPEHVIIHETGHQFWYGVVGTNEFEHAWMDEGINTWATARVMAEAYGGRFVRVERYFGGLLPWAYEDVRWSRDSDGNRILAYRAGPSSDAPSTPSWRYWPQAGGALSYAKTALWLTALERILGWETVRTGLSAFFVESAYRHPSPEQFFARMASASGQDLRWFFDAVHQRASTFDYAVHRVSNERTDDGSIDCTIIVRRLGDGVFPVAVRTTFEDGSLAEERWDGAERWRSLRYRRGARIATVEIDPDRVLTLDLDYTNNSWTARPRAAEASFTLAVRWMTWLQQALLTYAFFV
jgi:hypothetical protein